MTTPVHPENTDVVVTVTLPIFGGVSLIPSAVTRTVKDETGGIVSASQAVTVPGGSITAMDITIPAALNAIPGRRAARSVEIAFTTTHGVFVVVETYLLEAAEQLTSLVNTFVTTGEALMTRRDLPALDGWDAALEADRNAALVTAHRSLCRLTYRYKNDAAVLQSRVTWGQPEYEGFVYVTDIESITLDEWASVPLIFRQALQRAQMAEADVLLRGDPVGDKRRTGIIMERTGEAAMSFRETPEVRQAVSREALDHLAGYIYRDRRIARA